MPLQTLIECSTLQVQECLWPTAG